jgi:hypothetical protein
MLAPAPAGVSKDNTGSALAVVGCVFVLLLSAGCGGVESNTPRSVAKAYEQAIISKDGDALCATFAPKLREVLAEQVTDEQVAAGATERPRFDCGSFYQVATPSDRVPNAAPGSSVLIRQSDGSTFTP